MACLKDNNKILEDKTNIILEEIEIDILSEELFEQLYKNLIFFYNKNKKDKKDDNKIEEQISIFSEIVNTLDIIYESDSNCFEKNDFLKSVLIYLIYSFKKLMNINLEIVLKIFFEFGNHMTNISTIILDNHLSNFESEIIETLKALVVKYIQDYQIDLTDLLKENNFKDIMKYISKCEQIPLYLMGFIKYYKEDSKKKKFLISRVYKYLIKINPYKKGESLFNLYQGYALYELFSYQNTQMIEFNQFNNIKINRIKNENARNILVSSIELLKAKTNLIFHEKISKLNFEHIFESQRISDIFDETKKYYEDLDNQLKYYLTKYEEKKNLIKIINKDIARILWLNFIKILFLNLKEDDIEKNEIKIIFYLIVNLFNPDIDDNSLEFRDNAVFVLFCQCEISNEILNNQEIYRIIDKNYSDYYPTFIKVNTFKQAYINLKNEEILENPGVIALRKDDIIDMQIRNILKCNKSLPFPLLQDYLATLHKKVKITFSNMKEDYYNFYKNSICDIDDNNIKNLFKNFDNAKMPDTSIRVDIKNIIDNDKFINLINEIMKSHVMEDAYMRLYIWYSTDGEFNLNKDEIEENDLPKDNEVKHNLINGKSIKEYYDEFCNSIKNLDYFKRFIIMALPEEIKGFTFQFLKICINYQGIKLIYGNIKNKLTLLKAYLVFVIIHELNHFIKRYFNINKLNNVSRTPIIKGSDDKGEGGQQLIKLLFGEVNINKFLNVEQAEYILDINNWNKKSVIQFRKNFSLIKKDNNKDESMVYLSSEKESICDHSKLFA